VIFDNSWINWFTSRRQIATWHKDFVVQHQGSDLGFHSPFCLCQISAIFLPKDTVIDRKSSNGQNGAECCLACIYAIFAVISEVVKKACIGAEVHGSALPQKYSPFPKIARDLYPIPIQYAGYSSVEVFWSNNDTREGR
jgi:hypothetical protein